MGRRAGPLPHLGWTRLLPPELAYVAKSLGQAQVIDGGLGHPGNGGPRERAPLPTTSPCPSSWPVARPSTCGHAPRPCCRAWTTTPRLSTAGSPRDGHSTPPGRRGTLCTGCPLSSGTACCRPRCATSSPRRRAGSASAPVWPHRGRRSHHRNVRPHGYRPCTTVRDQSDRLVTDEAGG